MRCSILLETELEFRQISELVMRTEAESVMRLDEISEVKLCKQKRTGTK